MVHTLACTGASHSGRWPAVLSIRMPVNRSMRAEDGAVDHHRRLLPAVGVDVEDAEPLRQVEIHLDRPALPVAADGVAQHVLELRAVEGALAGIDAGLDLAAGPLRDLLQDLRHHPFGVVPQGIGADPLVRPRGELHQHLVEAEVAVDRQDEIVHLHALVGELLLGAEDVRVVLGEAAHAHQPVQRARKPRSGARCRIRRRDRAARDRI